jgi:hypothetical protein
MSEKPKFMTHERIMAGEEYISYSDYLLLQRERDEARDKLADWEDSAKHVRSEWPDEQHCSCVPILRKLLKDAERERDKWEETARLYCQNSDYHREMREKAERERDEARAERDKYWASIIQIDEITKNAGMKEDAK